MCRWECGFLRSDLVVMEIPGLEPRRVGTDIKIIKLLYSLRM